MSAAEGERERGARPESGSSWIGAALLRAAGLSRADLLVWMRRQGEIEAEARSGFFVAPAAMMVGIACVYGLGLRPSVWLSGLLALVCLLAATRLRHGDFLRRVVFAAGMGLVGVSLSAAELARVSTTTFSGEATVRIEGRVLWRDRDDRERLRYLVRVERTERPLLSRPPERVRILVSSRHEAIPIGGTYEGLVRLRPPSGPAFPGAYDFAFGSHFDGLGAYGFGLGPPEPPGETAASLSPGERFLALRLSIGERIRETIGGPQGAVAAALITGDRAGIPDAIDGWLRTAGLSHVLSISGLHMALVAGFAMITVRAALAALPWCALMLPIKKLAAVAAFAVATFYLLIAGSNVATDRSYIMLSIVLLAVLFDRPALTLRNVAIAAMMVLALSPHAMMTASFQMSFAATAAMIGVYTGYRDRRETSGRGASDRGPLVAALVFLAGLGLTSVVAGLATGPYSAYHFQNVQPFGVVANVVALPLFSFWIMPLALIAMLAMPFGLDGPFLHLMGYGLTLVFEIARIVSDHLPDAPTGLMTRQGLVLLSLALVLGAFLASALRWIAVPLAALGLLLAPSRAAPPELLVFEDGREIALIDAKGRLSPLREKPNDFVFSQWQRAYPPSSATPQDASASTAAFTCRIIEPDIEVAEVAAPVSDSPRPPPGATDAATARAGEARTNPPVDAAAARRSGTGPGAKGRRLKYCTATTRGGLDVVWTDDYRETGRACDEADIAIVARAIRLSECRSGAHLVTLRSLRRSGSLAVSASLEDGKPIVAPSIGSDVEEWNLHRLAPWPESWRKPAGSVEGQTGTAGEPVIEEKSGRSADQPSGESVMPSGQDLSP